MNDNEVLDAMKQTVSPVQLDRPVEEILRRGRARRRNRTAAGLAGGGLAAVAALALTLTAANFQPAKDAVGRAAAPPAAATSAPAKMVPVGWTLSRASDSQVKLALSGEQILDPDALQRALDEAGIHAVIKTRVLCTPKNAELPEANAVYRTAVEPPDYQYTFIITPAKMPAGSRLYFSIFNPLGGKKLAKVAVALVSNDDPMICKQPR